MSANDDAKRSEAEAELESEILRGRKFTLKEAVATMAEPGAMKGESPVTRMWQAESEIELWLGSHMADAGGALKVVLHRQVKGERSAAQRLRSTASCFGWPLSTSTLFGVPLDGARSRSRRRMGPCHGRKAVLCAGRRSRDTRTIPTRSNPSSVRCPGFSNNSLVTLTRRQVSSAPFACNGNSHCEIWIERLIPID
jgi:hypothetical protein